MIPLRGVSILLISILLVSCGAAVYFLFWSPERLELEGKSLQELLEGGELGTIAVIAVSLLITAAVMLSTLRTMFPPDIKNGIIAQAKVLKVWDTGTTINDDPQIGLLLEVTPASDVPFQAETKTLVSRLTVALVQPGVPVEVKYDPQNPKRLRVEAIHTEAPAPSGAAARMEELNELRDKGLITADEYREKREEILRAL
jgi:hypothetical protein